MQSSKTSKKTVKTTPAKAPSAPQETAQTVRAPRSSKSKVESADTATNHHHKAIERALEPAINESETIAAPPFVVSKTVVVEPAFTATQKSTNASDPSGQVTHEDIARLAHSFWSARGFGHGDPEQDWLRAEEQLKTSAASA